MQHKSYAILFSVFTFAATDVLHADPAALKLWGTIKHLSPTEASEELSNQILENAEIVGQVVSQYCPNELRIKTYIRLLESGKFTSLLYALKHFSGDSNFIKHAARFVIFRKEYTPEQIDLLYKGCLNTDLMNSARVLEWLDARTGLSVNRWQDIPESCRNDSRIVREFLKNVSSSSASEGLSFALSLPANLRAPSINGWAAGVPSDCFRLREMLANTAAPSLEELISVELIGRDPVGCNLWWSQLNADGKSNVSEWVLRNISDPAVWKHADEYIGVNNAVDIKLAVIRAGMFPDNSIKTFKRLFHTEAFHGIDWQDFGSYISPADCDIWFRFVETIDDTELQIHILKGIISQIARFDLKKAISRIVSIRNPEEQLELILIIDEKTRLTVSDLSPFAPEKRASLMSAIIARR